MSKKTRKTKNKMEDGEQNGLLLNKGKYSGIRYALLPMMTAIFSLLLFKIYMDVTHIPEMPKMDLDAWWGPNNTKEIQDTSIRPYRIVFSEAMLDLMNKKFEFYRNRKNVDSFPHSDISYGYNSNAFKEIFEYWCFKYNAKQREKYFNKYPHFITNIQGLDIHYVHIVPAVDKSVKVVPILLLHGWPGSIKEFYEAIPQLTTVRSGYDFVFEVIVPSLPGFGYSEGSVRPGLNTVEIAIIMHNLMQRIGINQFYVQGGDFGHQIGSHMATLYPKEVLGFHTNFVVNFNNWASVTWLLGSVWPKLIVEEKYRERMYPLSKKISYYLKETGYMHLQMTKPDTIGVTLQDSPVGLAVYMLDRIAVFTDPAFRDHENGGLAERFTFEDLLDNIMVYWTTGCITTSLRLYAETLRSKELEQTMFRIPTTVATWGLRLKNEIVYQPDFLVRIKFSNFVGGTTLDEGGHYAALEMPAAFADDVFAAVNTFMKIS